MEGLEKHKAPKVKEAMKLGDLKNISGVTLQDPNCDSKKICVCAGSLVYGQNALKKIGVTEPRLMAGTSCVVGDFDGNGYADFAFLQPRDEQTPASDVQVLLFDERGLTATAKMPKKMVSLARVRMGNKDVLVEPGAESKYHFAYRDANFHMVRKPAQ